MQIRWTDETVREYAKTCTSRTDFQRKYPAGYRYARLNNIVRELFPMHYRGNKTIWTAQTITKEALKYQSRVEFSRKNGSAYNAAQKLKILDDLFSYVKNQWSYESLKQEASNFDTRVAFYRGNGSAYATALRLGYLDEFYPDKTKSPSAFDVIYVWEAVGQYFNGHKVYKIGVTSKRLHLLRIEQVSKASGFDYTIVKLTEVDCDANLLENEIHALGDDPKYVGFNGHSEFRSLSPDALVEAIAMIDNRKKHDVSF